MTTTRIIISKRTNTQHYATQHEKAQHDTSQLYPQFNDTQHNNYQLNNIQLTTLSMLAKLSILTFSITKLIYNILGSVFEYFNKLKLTIQKHQ